MPAVEYDMPWFLDHPGPSAERLRHQLRRSEGGVLADALAHPSCQVLLDLVLGNDKPLFVAWGDELRVLYNDACSTLFQGSVAMGQKMRDVWADRWRELGPGVEQVMRSGHARMRTFELSCGLRGHPLARRFLFDCSPVNDPLSNHGPLGLFCACRGEKASMLTPPRRSNRPRGSDPGQAVHPWSPRSTMTGAPEPSFPSVLHGDALRVLIADDHMDAAETLAMLVSLEGHAVEVARNGHEALELAGRLRPDVAILDIGMPGLDGHTVAHRIRQTKAGASMLIVALTGRGDTEDKERARQAGFDEHFTKPVDPAELLGCISTWRLGRASP